MDKKYRCALFDWDGCLGDSLSVSLRNYKIIASKNGINFTDYDYQSAVGNWEISAKSCGYQDVNEFKAVLNKLTKDHVLEVGLNPNVKSMLESLKEKKAVMGILTSSSRDVVKVMLENNEILEYFDEIVGYEDVDNIKPHPEVVYKLIELLKVSKEDSLVIGDTENDIIAASNAGIDSVLYVLENNKRFYGDMDFKGYKPTYEIHDFNELQKFF